MKLCTIIIFFLIVSDFLYAPTPPFLSTQTQSVALRDLSFEEKVGQLLMVRCAQDTAAESILHVIERCHIGGVFFLAPESIEQQIQLTNQFQEHSKLPLLIGQDLEWGLHMRHKQLKKFPYALTLGALPENNNKLIYTMGQRVAAHARKIGVHLTAAPVLDSNTNPKNPIIGFRSFGATAEKVIERAIPYMHGLQEGGSLSCAKHFPGHGDTTTDSHHDKTYVTKKLEELEAVELVPFAHAINSGVDMVMAGHLVTPAMDPDNNPATLSPAIIGYLKKKLGFQGLVITDALDMGAIANHYTPADAVIKAFVAGNDIILFPVDIENSCRALKEFVSAHPEYQQQLDDSVEKILRSKHWLGVFDNRYTQPIEHPERDILSAVDYDLKKELYQNAVTLVHGTLDTVSKKTIVHLGNPVDMNFFDELCANAPVYSFQEALGQADLKHLIITFATTARGAYDSASREQLQKLLNSDNVENATLILFGNPNVLSDLPEVPTLIVAYEIDPEAQKAAARVIRGDFVSVGILP